MSKLIIVVSEKNQTSEIKFFEGESIINMRQGTLSIEHKAKLIAYAMKDMWKYLDDYKKYCENIDDKDKWYKFEEYHMPALNRTLS